MVLFDERPLEKKVEGDAVKWAKKNGWLSIKIGYDGWPDRIFNKGLLVVYIEFKRLHEEPTVLQERRIKELRENGSIVTVKDTTISAIEFLKLCESAQGL
jgi:hypothetical protein